MFPGKERTSKRETEQFLQRIADLEAQLDAAHQLITDQQQMLRANLVSSIITDSDYSEDLDEASGDSKRLSPLRISAGTDMPASVPVKLPDFGMPAIDIANQVMQAARETGLDDATVRKPLRSTVSMVLPNEVLRQEASGQPQRPKADPVKAPPANKWRVRLPHPRLACSAVLLICAAGALSWSQYKNLHREHMLLTPVPDASLATVQPSGTTLGVKTNGVLHSNTKPAIPVRQDTGHLSGRAASPQSLHRTHPIRHRRSRRLRRKLRRAPSPVSSSHPTPPTG